jgi:hypothetical protein
MMRQSNPTNKTIWSWKKFLICQPETEARTWFAFFIQTTLEGHIDEFAYINVPPTTCITKINL